MPLTLDTIIDGLIRPISYFLDPEKRIFWGYLLSSAAMAYFVFRQSKVKTSFLEYLIPKKMWRSGSTLVDLGMMFSNGLVKVLLIGPYFVFGFQLAESFESLLVNFLGYPSSAISAKVLIIAYSITLTILMDLSTYLVHFCMHRIPILWEFHKTHHSATTLVPLTQYRIHPIELLINNAKAIAIMGLVTGLYSYLSPHPLKEITIIGANIFSFAFMLFGANLRHSHVAFSYPVWLENILISPLQHQIHHSDKREHFDKNLGAKLAIWDKFFGTLIRSHEVEKISFGIGAENENYHSFWQNMLNPFRKIWKWLKEKIRV